MHNTSKFDRKINSIQDYNILNSIINVVSEGLVLADFETGYLVYANNSFMELFNYNKEEIENLHFTKLHPENLRNEFIRLFNETSSEYQFEVPIPCLKKDGKLFHCIVKHKLIEINGIVYNFASFTDVTEKYLLEKELINTKIKLDKILEVAPVGINIADKKGNLIYANSFSQYLLGLTEEQITKRQIDGVEWEIIRLDYSKMPPDEYASVRALKENKLITNVEMGVVKGKNDISWINVSATPLNYDEVLIIYNDITNYIEKKNELEQKQEELINIIEQKNKLLSIIAHDLKSPFNGLLGFIKLLINNYDYLNESEIKEYLNFINISAEKNFHLIDELLLWAKLQDKSYKFEKEQFFICDILEEIRYLYSSNPKFININISSYTRIPIKANLNLIKTLFRNLVSNSIKFTKEYGYINLIIEKIDNNLQILIEDNGIGISEENLRKIFNNEKVTTLGTNNETGTGLGLSICKEIVELHNGNMIIESELNKGTKIKITLPLVD